MTNQTSYKEIVATILVDLIMLQLAWQVYAEWLDLDKSIFEYSWQISWELGAIILSVYWILVLAGGGMYTNVFLISRLDETIRLLKSSFVGILLLFFAVTVSTESLLLDASTIVLKYWITVFASLLLGRLTLRTTQRLLAKRSLNLRKAIVVGTSQQAKDVVETIRQHPTLGVSITGFVQGPESSLTQRSTEISMLGNYTELPTLIAEHNVTDVIITERPDHEEEWLQLLDILDIPGLSIKILPDFYQQIQGLNKTNQIFGLPLIDIMTDPMPVWEKVVKRIMDVVIALLILMVTLPLQIIIAILIKITSQGPAIYKQQRVGRFGKPFTMYKFRTMKANAESESGPVWAKEDDPRITAVGHWLRKFRLDELPQFVNVLKGEMSLVGPRPERPHFVDQFKQEIPLYTRRLRVRPGITGWAQVKWKYDSDMEDVKEKIRYDLFYLENRSLRMDLKILVNTFVTVLRARGL
ncbi:MAG: sugar transferase [Bacteroidota bacterium]